MVAGTLTHIFYFVDVLAGMDAMSDDAEDVVIGAEEEDSEEDIHTGEPTEGIKIDCGRGGGANPPRTCLPAAWGRYYWVLLGLYDMYFGAVVRLYA